MKERFLAAALFIAGACSPARAQIPQGELNSYPRLPSRHELIAKRYTDAILAGDAALANSFTVPRQKDGVNSVISALKGCQVLILQGVDNPSLRPKRKQVNLRFQEPCGLEDMNINRKLIGAVIFLHETSNQEYAVEAVRGVVRRR